MITQKRHLVNIVFHIGHHKTASSWLQEIYFTNHPDINLINNYFEPWNVTLTCEQKGLLSAQPLNFIGDPNGSRTRVCALRVWPLAWVFFRINMLFRFLGSLGFPYIPLILHVLLQIRYSAWNRISPKAQVCLIMNITKHSLNLKMLLPFAITVSCAEPPFVILLVNNKLGK